MTDNIRIYILVVNHAGADGKACKRARLQPLRVFFALHVADIKHQPNTLIQEEHALLSKLLGPLDNIRAESGKPDILVLSWRSFYAD